MKYKIRPSEEVIKKMLDKPNLLGSALFQINQKKRLNRQLVRARKLGIIQLYKVG